MDRDCALDAAYRLVHSRSDRPPACDLARDLLFSDMLARSTVRDTRPGLAGENSRVSRVLAIVRTLRHIGTHSPKAAGQKRVGKGRNRLGILASPCGCGCARPDHDAPSMTRRRNARRPFRPRGANTVAAEERAPSFTLRSVDESRRGGLFSEGICQLDSCELTHFICGNAKTRRSRRRLDVFTRCDDPTG
jgi:hypothetical protein